MDSLLESLSAVDWALFLGALRDVFFAPGLWVAGQIPLPPEHPFYDIVVYGVGLLLYSPVVRFLLVVLLRRFGLYHPALYRRWPGLPWRAGLLLWLRVMQWKEQVFAMGKRATGSFAGTLSTLARLYRPGFLLLGRASALGIGILQPVGIKVERHIFIMAMTGAGKTAALIAMLSCWRGSAWIIDPKGQITRALAKRDKRRWVVIDPYGISGQKSAGFNAFDCLRAAVARDGEGAAVIWATRIAYALIITPPGSRTPYFSETARGFLSGLILHIYTQHPPEQQHLPFVRDLIVSGYRVFNPDGTEQTKGNEAQALLLRAMSQNPAFDGAIAGAASALVSASDEVGGNVRSTLQEQTKWLDIPSVRAVLKTTDLPLSDLKTRDDVVLAFCAPVLSVREELSRLSRLLTNMAAYTFEAVPKKKGQCLSVIDELPAQGHNATLEVTIPVARSQGQTVVGIAQNEALLRNAYPKTADMFTGEADAVLWMATNDTATAEKLSRRLGNKTHIEIDPQTHRKSYRDVPVMDTEQVGRFLTPEAGRLIVTRAGARAMRLRVPLYFKELPIWAYDPDPDHKEPWLRRLSRFCLGQRHRKPHKTRHTHEGDTRHET